MLPRKERRNGGRPWLLRDDSTACGEYGIQWIHGSQVLTRSRLDDQGGATIISFDALGHFATQWPNRGTGEALGSHRME